ncbi:hypothetical protein [Microbacterium nanhaiense]|nr:hypothetical protein [Microbacterium nanhaiense]
MRWTSRARRERQESPKPRSARHGRHGRVGRSALTKPPLPAIGSRYDRFNMVFLAAVDLLRREWPELKDVRFELGSLPVGETGERMPRWTVDRANNLVIVHRVVVERLDKAHGQPLNRTDEFHRRLLIENAVFGGAAEYLGRDPYDLGADPFH